VLWFLLSAVLYWVGFELADGFVATSVLLAPPADKLMRDADARGEQQSSWST
jgi:hypothetical protein